MPSIPELIFLPSAGERAAFRRALLAWFDREARDLPWRRTRDPYAVWISEILLQQTRVSQGMPYYERFMATFPDVQTLANASEHDVLKCWEGLGYYTRARNLHKASKQVVEQHHGRLPDTLEGWRALPGIGPYTAAAIASIAFGRQAAVLDGNVKRVLARLANIAASIDSTAMTAQLWALAESLTPPKRPGDYNQAMMELGARICVPHRPMCLLCPVARHCQARVAGVEQERPVRTVKSAIPTVQRWTVIIVNAGKWLLIKRPSEGFLGGLWEFPAITEPFGGPPETTLPECVRQAFGVSVRIEAVCGTVTQVYSHFRETLTLFRCAWVKGKPRMESHVEALWASPDELNVLALSKAARKAVECGLKT